MFRDDEYEYEHDSDGFGEEEEDDVSYAAPRSLLDQCVDTGLISPDALPHGFRPRADRQTYEAKGRFHEAGRRNGNGPFDQRSARPGFGTDYRSADGRRRRYSNQEPHEDVRPEEDMDPEVGMESQDDSPLISARGALWVGSLLAVYFLAKSRYQKQAEKQQQLQQQQQQQQQQQPDMSGWIPGVIKW